MHWLRRTQANRAEIEALYDARFYRMWEFYLAGAASGFVNSQMVNFQLQYVRDRTALPITRDYMAEAESALHQERVDDDQVRGAGAPGGGAYGIAPFPIGRCRRAA